VNRLISLIPKKLLPLALEHLQQRKDLVAGGHFLSRELTMSVP
jgi:hypothetical protein